LDRISKQQSADLLAEQLIYWPKRDDLSADLKTQQLAQLLIGWQKRDNDLRAVTIYPVILVCVCIYFDFNHNNII